MSDEDEGKSWLDNLAALHPNPKPKPSTIRETGSVSQPVSDISDARRKGWLKGALDSARDNIVNAKSRGQGRNQNLNTEAFNLISRVVDTGLMTEQALYDFLYQAACDSGLDTDANCGPKGIDDTIRSGFRGGRAKISADEAVIPSTQPQVTDDPSLGWRNDYRPPSEAFDPDGPETINGKQVGPGARIVSMGRFADVPDQRPVWVWHYNGGGRIPLRTLSIFGGPPGTGKSTAARWFAAEASNGTLDGIWHGEPVNVAYLAIEEDLDAMVKPSLRAAGADISRLFYPKVVMDDTERILMSKGDEKALTEQLLEYDIRLLVVDPIMSTLGATTDIHRNNEVREALQPFVNIAESINGFVIGIAHYRKSGAASGVAALTGSSAFGEVARSVFGFMKGGMDPDEPRVMSQSKNSAGPEDLALQYQLEITPVLFPDGIAADMTRFKILGESSVTVEDLMAEGGAQTRTRLDDACGWLEDYLMINGESPSKQIKIDANKDADINESTLKRACSRLKLVVTNKSIDGRPRITFWDLPPDEDLSPADRAAGPDHDF